MYKSKFMKLSIFLPLVVMLMYFQNCAPSKKFETVLSSLESASEIDQIHRDADHGTTIPTAEKPGLEYSKTLLDREMLFSLFVDIFGANAPTQIAALKSLKSNRALFGAACSVYDNFKSGAGMTVDPAAVGCANEDTPSNLSAPTNPAGNTLHQALINDVCQQGVSNATTYAYVLAQLKDDPAQLVPRNSSENVLKLFRLFYRSKPEPELSLVQSLQALVGEPATADGWKLAISTTCVSSQWQAL